MECIGIVFHSVGKQKHVDGIKIRWILEAGFEIHGSWVTLGWHSCCSD